MKKKKKKEKNEIIMQLVLSFSKTENKYDRTCQYTKKLITHKIWWSFQCADHNTSQTEDVWFSQTTLDAVSLTLCQTDVKTCCLNSQLIAVVWVDHF